MPFCIPTGYGGHIETCVSKLLVHLVSHLKALQRDARAYDSLQLAGLRAISRLHLLDCFLDNALYRTPPSCMYGTRCVVFGII